MRWLLGWIVLLLVCAASASASVEVGECAPVKPGPYSDTACVVAKANGNHLWRELSGVGATFTDGHPAVADEQANFTAPGFAMKCAGTDPEGAITSYTTDTQKLRFWKCELLPSKTACGTAPEREILTEEMTGVIGEEEGFATNTWTGEMSFMCGTSLVTFSGSYTGRYLSRLVGDETTFSLNNDTTKAYLHVGTEFGAQSWTATVDGVPLTGLSLDVIEEMRFGGPAPTPPNKHVVFRAL